MLLISLICLHPNEAQAKALTQAFHEEMGSDLQSEDEIAGEFATITLDGFEGFPLQAVTGARWEEGCDPQDAMEDWVGNRAIKRHDCPWLVMMRPETLPSDELTWVWSWDGIETSLASFAPKDYPAEQGVFPRFPGHENLLVVLESAKKAHQMDQSWPQRSESPPKPRM